MKKIIFLITILMVSSSLIKVQADSAISMYVEKGDNKGTIKSGDIITVNYVMNCWVENDICSTFSPENGKFAIIYDSNIFSIVEENNYSFVNPNLILAGVSGYASNMYKDKEQVLSYEFDFIDNFKFQTNSNAIVASVKFKVKKDLITQDTFIYSNALYGEVLCTDEINKDICAKDRGLKLQYHIDGKSEDSSLKNLSIDIGKLLPEFSEQNKEYVVNVDYNVSTITINAVANNKNATILGLGTKKLNYGANVFNILCKSESGKESKYTITVNRASDNRSNDSQLKYVIVKDDNSKKNIQYDFITTQYDYEIDVPYDVKKIELDIKPNNDNATFIVSGDLNLKVGTNEISIITNAENGTEKTYKYKINRLEEKKVKLTSLRVFGYELSPNFSSDNYVYSIDYTGKEDSLEILYETDGDLAKVYVIGNSNLKKNAGDIKLRVIGETDNNEVTYVIHLNRIRQFDHMYIIIGGLAIITCSLTIYIIRNKKNQQK